MSLDKPTLTDNDSGYTTAVTCSITGNSIIRNSGSSSGNCIKVSNGSSNISIQCDYIEGIGGFGSTGNLYNGASVLITNITDAQRFSLACNKISNQYNSAIAFDTVSSGTNKNTVNIKVNKIDTGVIDDDNVTPSVVLKGTGFIEIEEINSLNSGSCLLHQAGTITANILKMITKNVNHFSAPYFPTVEVSGGDGTQKLTLYFDEIQNLLSSDTVKVSNGTATFIGRRIYSQSGLSMDLSSNVDCICDEIISGTKGIYIHNSSTKKIIIDANKIEGSNGNNGVVKSANGSNYVLRNAKIKNISNSGDSVCIYIDSGSTLTSQTIEIENLILVSGNVSSGKTIFRAGSTAINVKNLGLFVNKAIDEDMIILEIGLGLDDPDYNYKYIVSTDIS